MAKKIQKGTKIQITLPAKLAKDVEATIQEDGYGSVSEFGISAIQEYIWRKQHGLINAKASGGLLTNSPFIDMFCGEQKGEIKSMC